jgi:iron(III) transport system substrate-binding protein
VKQLWAVIAGLWLLSGGIAAAARADADFPAPGNETAILAIHAATDLPAMEPLIRDFQAVSPGTTIRYTEYVTNDLQVVATEACRTQQPTGDLLLSSSVDHLVKLANDGCAQSHVSAETAAVPDWANWRDEVFGFTFEPAVFVINQDLVPAQDIPRSHLELADLLRTRINDYRGRVGTYDIRLSGIGYLLAFNDSWQANTTYGRLLESLGRAEPVVRCCTSEILDELISGRVLIGYNMLGSYAYARIRNGAPLRIIVPRDYTLVLSRGAMIPSTAQNPQAAAAFLDYLLSARGQKVAAEQAFFFSPDAEAPPEIDGPSLLSASGAIRPITIDPTLLVIQDRALRERFLNDWAASMIGIGAPQ